MKKIKIIGLLFLTITLFNACTREVIPPEQINIGLEYFPLSQGHYIEYDVDSIIYDDFNLRTDTFKRQLRDEVGATFLDNEGRTSYIINRYVKVDTNDSVWHDNQTFYTTQTTFKLEWIENNLRFIKLIYPVKQNTKWLGNVYLPTVTSSDLQWLDGWEYKYTNIADVYNNGVKSYDNTLTVQQADITEGNPSSTSSYSARSYSKEVYAKNVGLIFKELTHWVYQPTVSTYKKGFTVIMRAKNNN